MSRVPDRIRWAVELVDPRPTDRILEVGGGPGVAATLICPRLTTGRLVALDRSETAVRRTRDRNAEHLASGRLEVQHAELADLTVPPASLDMAFAIDVNLFWTRVPTVELAALERGLRPGARLYVCFGAGGPQAPERVTDPIAEALAGQGFRDVTIHRGDERGLAVSGTMPD